MEDAEPLVSLLMLVTPRDRLIASQTLPSFRKVYEAGHPFARRFEIVVYLNGVSPGARHELDEVCRRLPFCRTVDNADVVTRPLVAGELVTTPEGAELEREGPYELCGEVWSREVVRLPARYVGTVDADFEVLDPDFFLWMLEELERDPSLAALSTDFYATAKRFDSYSNEHIVLHERWCTWLCIYRREHLVQSGRSHFYFERRLPDGMRYVYDDAAYLQEDLTQRLGFAMRSVPARYRSSYIHYGATSKLKRKQSPLGIRLYRHVLRASEVGLLFGSRLHDSRAAQRLNYAVRRATSAATTRYRARVAAEKARY